MRYNIVNKLNNSEAQVFSKNETQHNMNFVKSLHDRDKIMLKPNTSKN